jgi:hypothetical protein
MTVKMNRPMAVLGMARRSAAQLGSAWQSEE